MAKVPKLHIEGALFYVTNRGDNNEAIFKDDADYAMYLELMKKYLAQHQCRMFAYALLPNHLHLLIELKEKVTISDVMHDLNANYTKYFNAKYDRKGHLFQERNKLVLVEKALYLAKVGAYIHLNSKILGLVSDPAEYKYSSLPIYMGASSGQAEVALVSQSEKKEMLASAGVAEYKDYFVLVAFSQMQELARSLRKNAILGSDEFVAKVQRKAQEYKAQAEPVKAGAGQKTFVLAGSIAIILLLVFTFNLYRRSVALKNAVNKESAAQEVAVQRRMAQERVKIARSLDEKYRADMVSYAAMARRLELEKNKAKQLDPKR